MRNSKWIVGLVLTILAIGCSTALEESQQAQPYEPSWESLSRHIPAPEWFRDAKFGIYFHWGVYCVPAYGSEWYPRNMHIKTGRRSDVYRHHVKTYGDPAKYGYHKFVPQFKAGANVGPVPAAEVGVVKRDILYLSEILHVAARI